MNYSILSAWSREFGLQGRKVESVNLANSTLRLRFSDKTDLVLLAAADAFAFHSLDFQPADNEVKIWDALTHAVLTGAEIDPADRIIRFRFTQTDIYQQNKVYLLIAEFTPPKPNLILALQNEELVIVDALRKYSYADNPQRQILPRLPYQPAKTSFQPILQEVSPPLRLESLKTGATLLCPSVNDYLANFYHHVFLAREEAQRRQTLRSRWERELKKAKDKLAKQQAEAADADKAEYWMICAETLKTNLPNINRGQTSFTAINYYDPELATIEIPLQPQLSARQNLQAYLKKYGKARRGKELIAAHIAATQQQIAHLVNILARVEAGEEVEAPSAKSIATLGRKLDMEDRLLKLRLSEDFEIVIGRKASENDFITTQLGRPHDWWFHTRIYRGSHILLRCFRKTAPGDELINICCSLAAWYSKARFSLNVPVDYTQVRFVRKPRKSPPGFVTYTEHKTVFADPRDLRSLREELKL
ncbi:MAG: NFACT RNA binding domain-containing protein [Candidatus Cloacimonetes bacterium]|nr:NFACT RNA binding domain-containing protein [Candidatus Cloacimonadota bacterium]MDY0366965.1 NFACT RNA binding domain-containing protein [Candidatus Syntrophosphaera sp.]